MSLIKLHGITKNFWDGEGRINHLLRGVDMSVEAGEFVAIQGVSGSGKSTLLSILGTIISPDSGSHLFDSEEMTTRGVDRARVRNEHIGFVFQDHRLLPQLSVADNILLPTLAYNNAASAEQVEYAVELMRISAISSIANQYPGTVSGGESARAALCRALIMRPKLLLADEPTGQLDSQSAKRIIELLKQINNDLGTAIVMVTHSDQVAGVASRILTLNDGLLR